jgi:hypothetical protein
VSPSGATLHCKHCIRDNRCRRLRPPVPRWFRSLPKPPASGWNRVRPWDGYGDGFRVSTDWVSSVMRFFLAYFSRYRPNTRDDPVVSQWCSSPPLVHVRGGKLRVADYAKTSGFPDRFTRVTWAMPHADPPPEGGRRNAVPGRWATSTCRRLGIHGMRLFVMTLRRNIAATKNAICEWWSNGQAEDQINHTKH